MKPQFPTPDDNKDNARLMQAIAISLAILFAFHFLYEKPQQEAQLKQQQEIAAKAQMPVTAAPAALKTRTEALAGAKRIKIEGDKVTGSLSLTGARIDDLSLNDHLEDDLKTHVELLTPSGADGAYYVESGWTSADTAARLPDDKTVWHLAPGSASVLKTGGSVTLAWDNGQGLSFTRKIELDDSYMFQITQSVTNKTAAARQLNAWYLISRHGLPLGFKGFFILHEGPIAYLDGKLKEINYKDLAKGENTERDNVHGWLGIADKYWFVGVLPRPEETFDARVVGSKAGDIQSYQADIVGAAQVVQPGQTAFDKKLVFAGVKSLPLTKSYQEKYGIPRLDLVFDFGMWYFITKPFFFLLHFLMSALGNVGLSILAMTVIVRGAVFPLANKSFRSMARMKKVAPQLKELQEKYGQDRERLQMEIFELYRRENVNPFSGCWPMLIQIPIFFALYKSILLSVELRHAPFWGWIHDLSAPDPTNLFTLFGLIPWEPPAALHIGLWPVLFCATMIIQKRLTPPMPDKTQEQLQGVFPYIITFMLAKFASGLVIYWTWSNTLGILQQYYILRSAGDKNVSLLRGHHERRKKKHHD